MCEIPTIGGDRENDLLLRSRLNAARNLGTPDGSKLGWSGEKPGLELPAPVPAPTAAPAPAPRPRVAPRPAPRLGAPGATGFVETVGAEVPPMATGNIGFVEEYGPPGVVPVAPAVPGRPAPTLVPRNRQNARASAAQMYGPPAQYMLPSEP